MPQLATVFLWVPPEAEFRAQFSVFALSAQESGESGTVSQVQQIRCVSATVQICIGTTAWASTFAERDSTRALNEQAK